MGIFDIFGGGDTSQATDQAINSIWQGNQAYNYAGNASMGILNDATGKAINYLQPYYNTGTAAQNQYAGALGVPGVPAYDPSQMVKTSPGYQFGLSQGNDALNASLSSQGLYGSGPQREAAQKFGQNYGMNYYNQLMNQLAGLGQQGQTAGNQMGGWQMANGQNLANIEMGMGANAQNTFATTAGMNLQSSLQDQRNNQANTLGWLGTGLNFLTGGLSGALGGGGGGGGSNFLGNMLGPLFSGAGGGGAGGISMAGVPDITSESLMAGLGGMFSDKRTKENIHPLMDMTPVSFDYIPEFGAHGQIGFVADDIEHLAPGMVTIGEDGYRRIHPMAIITLLVKEVQSLRHELNLLKSNNEQVN